MKKKLVVSIKNITPAQCERIAEAASEYGWTAELYDNKADGKAAARDCEVAFADSPGYTYDAPDLRWICSPSAGINHFTKSERFVSSGVMLSNSSGAYGVTIAEHVIMVTLAMLRKLPEYQAEIRQKNWMREYAIKSIKGSRVTMLGTGDIGTETAKRFRAFEPERITGVNTRGQGDASVFDEFVPVTDLERILPKTDILIMSLPGTAATYHIIDKEKLAALPDGALIVNVGRGTCIYEAALVSELKAGRLRAALDVFEKEPLDQESELYDCPNLLITPHVAGDMMLPYTVEKIVDMFIEDFRRYAEGGRPARAVDLTKGY